MVQLGRFILSSYPGYLCTLCDDRYFSTLRAVEEHCRNTRKHAWCERCKRVFTSGPRMINFFIWKIHRSITFVGDAVIGRIFQLGVLSLSIERSPITGVRAAMSITRVLPSFESMILYTTTCAILAESISGMRTTWEWYLLFSGFLMYLLQST